MMTLRSSLLGVARVAVFAGAATGCGGGSATSASGAGTSSDAQPATVPTFHLDHNARKAVTVRSCIAHPGGAWAIAGSVKNAGSKATDYTLVVDFVKVPGSTVVATKVVHVGDVGAGHTAQWKAQGGKADQKLGCILRYAQTG